MQTRHSAAVLVLAIILAAVSLSAQDEAGRIDKNALIDQILSVDARQRDQLKDVVMEAEYLEGKMEDDGFKQESRYIKKVYIKFLEDTALFHERYIEYYKEGELKSEKDRDKKAREKLENSRKRKARNVSYPMLEPFYPENREDYEITYNDVEEIGNYTCYHFTVKSLIEDDEHVNGEYFFETDGFHLVRVDFEPAKLVKKTMFKLNQLDMSIHYGPTSDGFWLPRQFDIAGKGKAAFLFGVNFAGVEYYRNPEVNVGLGDELFEVENDDD